MSVLLDTNILLRLTQPQHPQARIAEQALRLLNRRGEALCITQQNVVEFWVVVTRPVADNGLGFNPTEARAELDSVKRLFRLLPEAPLNDVWERLVVDYRVSGKSAHDARLVAAMIVHGIESILTFNVQDFERYREIRTIEPLTVA